jgi:hypothetical protein
LGKEDLERYSQQHKLVSSIVATFQKPDYSDERDGKTIARLVGEMQDLGGPPQEIMGDLPEGFVSDPCLTSKALTHRISEHWATRRGVRSCETRMDPLCMMNGNDTTHVTMSTDSMQRMTCQKSTAGFVILKP